jgi:hypothetical protein
VGYGANEVYIILYKNGSAYQRGGNMNITSGITFAQPSVTTVVSMNGTTDYLEGYIFQNTGSSQNLNGGSLFNNFSAAFVRSA